MTQPASQEHNLPLVQSRRRGSGTVLREDFSRFIRESGTYGTRSFQVATTDQAETDRYWNASGFGNGSEESERLVPRQMGRILADHAGGSDESDNPFRSLGRQRAFDAMM